VVVRRAADGFRQEVIAYLWATSRRGEKVSYKSYEPLKEAIENVCELNHDVLFESPRRRARALRD